MIKYVKFTMKILHELFWSYRQYIPFNYIKLTSKYINLTFSITFYHHNIQVFIEDSHITHKFTYIGSVLANMPIESRQPKFWGYTIYNQIIVLGKGKKMQEILVMTKVKCSLTTRSKCKLNEEKATLLHICA